MKRKVRKCLKWTFVTFFVLIVVRLMLRVGDGHRHYSNGGRGGIGFAPQANLHHSFAHGGFHGIGFILSLLFWVAIIAAVLFLVRKRVGKCCRSKRVTPEALLEEGWNQTTITAHGQFLDEWEKNLKKSKEE